MLLLAIASLVPPSLLAPGAAAGRAPLARVPLASARLARAPPPHLSLSVAEKLEQELLSCSDAKAALALFQKLEQLAPPPANLLTSSEAARLDGRWLLEYTIAAQAGSDDLSEVGIKGAVNGESKR